MPTPPKRKHTEFDEPNGYNSTDGQRADGDGDGDEDNANANANANDELDEDLKPSPSPKPTTPPAKRARKAPATPKPKVKTETQTQTPKKAKAKAPATPGASGSGKKSGAWSGDELLRLYTLLSPKATGVNWQDIAASVGGRDAKSCQNKWARIQDKIREAVMGFAD